MNLLRKLMAWQWRLRQDIARAGDLNTFFMLRSPQEEPREGYPVTKINIRLLGKTLPVHIRRGTFDLGLVNSILTEASEYRVPVAISPKVIVDAGANIGITALYFAALYPSAKIFCIEPLPANLELLSLNIKPFRERITIIPKGLGDKDGVMTFHPANSANDFSAGGFEGLGDTSVEVGSFPVTSLRSIMAEHRISAVDLMKLDIEGSEWAALQGTPADVVAGTKVIIGELHGNHDLEVIGYLSKTHRVGYHKNYWNDHATYFVAVAR